MASKTITIDAEAYERLSSFRMERESFSQTIKRLIRPKPDLEAFAARLAADPMSRKGIAAVEEHLRKRHEEGARSR